jgi:hypothetical protein
MTVAELITHLKNMDPNATVFVTTPEGNDKYTVAEVGSLTDGNVIVTVER